MENRKKNTADQIDFLLSISNEKEGLAFEALNNFAGCMSDLGKFKEAEQFYIKSIKRRYS